MSDTPRVDGAESCFGSFRFVSATFARQLERELAEEKGEVNTWKAVAEARLENFHRYHNQSLAYQEQLTAHKAALASCKAILKWSQHSAYCESSLKLNASCSCGLEKALSEIAKLTPSDSVNPNQSPQ